MLDIKREIEKLNFPEGDFMVMGSGILNALGLRAAKDIDLVVARAIYDELASRPGWIAGSWSGQVPTLSNDLFEVSYYWDDESSTVDKLLASSTEVDGINYMSLEWLRSFKQELGREKDLADIKLIDEYLDKHREGSRE